MREVTNYPIRSGRMVKENGNTVNIADLIDNQFYRLSTEPKPTAADGVKTGNKLRLVDTKVDFVFYQDQWWEI